jgi:hypothetical protein
MKGVGSPPILKSKVERLRRKAMEAGELTAD